MTMTRFFQFVLLSLLLVGEVSSLSNKTPPVTRSVSEMAQYGGYSYGEGCLLGSGSSQLWSGKKNAQWADASTKQDPRKEVSTFVPKANSGSSFTQSI
mmetsp:Transcript_72765/g.109750  ORF Transcript_72765/g.109750 Transcript_72765/m.109750 type:complete len:98 (+) Transcript_72765:120-413(+)|eukprot:CAMPEP_0117072052 /NCGR_PEP_ID=MMETSP0472-20121206/50674_1 /TAXON_ID=693140 ORGANISM="Tiarina fusus, Strain LIS" /NCGR_SAMPLE_ID=MMETSP0472 /ASSEMBLY_ACC=CAM_ASM_000603 /LENGTH=97 /DNA_ID=CAMNT_0004795919 /DNA_START=113 /DNA_END=406 /DNA_ORIENTATION=-